MFCKPKKSKTLFSLKSCLILPCLHAASHSSISFSVLATKYMISVLSPICIKIQACNLATYNLSNLSSTIKAQYSKLRAHDYSEILDILLILISSLLSVLFFEALNKLFVHF